MWDALISIVNRKTGTSRTIRAIVLTGSSIVAGTAGYIARSRRDTRDSQRNGQRRSQSSRWSTSRRRSNRTRSQSRDRHQAVNRFSQPIQGTMSFDANDVALMFAVCDPANSNGYGISAVSTAMMDFIRHQASPSRGHAISAYHQLLLATFPHDSVKFYVESERSLTKSYGDDSLTAELLYLETAYLRYIHGVSGRRFQVANLARQISDVVTKLERNGSQRRAAGARILLASLNLRQNQPEQADHEMRQAITMLREIERTMISSDSTTGTRQHADTH